MSERSLGNTQTEKINVGPKLSIFAVSIEHDVKDFKKNKELLERTIEASDGAILEYFIPEIEWARGNAVGPTESFEPFFSGVQEIAKEKNKDVYMLDPAHNKEYGFLIRGAQWASMGALITSVMYPGLNGRIPRRMFLKGLTGLGLIAGVPSVSWIAESFGIKCPIPYEATFRRAVIAKGIEQMSEDLDNDPNRNSESLALIYPPLHWSGIKDFLNNSSYLDVAFDTAKQLKGLGSNVNEALFSIRHYVPDNFSRIGWSLVEKKEIV